MSGSHRAEQTSKACVAVGGPLTARTLLTAPVGAAVAVLAIGGAAALGLAAPAYATPQEDAVVQQLNNAGYHYTNIPAMLGNAHTVCDRIGVGQSRDQIVNDIMGQRVAPEEATFFVNTSIANLCP